MLVIELKRNSEGPKVLDLDKTTSDDRHAKVPVIVFGSSCGTLCRCMKKA